MSANMSAKDRRRRRQIPTEILNDPLLAEASSALPRNYNWEIPKTVTSERLRERAARGLDGQ